MSFDLDPVLNFTASKLELITLFFATPTLFFNEQIQVQMRLFHHSLPCRVCACTEALNPILRGRFLPWEPTYSKGWSLTYY